MPDQQTATEPQEDFPHAIRQPDKLVWLTTWLVPLLVAFVCAYLLYDSFIAVGPTVAVTFDGPVSVERDKTPLRYRGVEVGRVSRVYLSGDMKKVVVEVRLDDFAENFAREGAQYWIVRPQVTTNGIQGIETLTSGSYIEAKPGNGAKKLSFSGLPQNPDELEHPDDLNLGLVAQKITSLKPDSLIYYRGVVVGGVKTIDIDKKHDDVKITVFIRSAYKDLVNASTKFWNQSAVEADFGLFSGAQLRISSLPALLSGSIAFITPDRKAPPLTTSSGITLYDAYDKSWDDQSETENQDAPGGATGRHHGKKHQAIPFNH